MKTKTVIFDLDGTIVNTGTPIANTINYVREFFDLPQMEKNHILKHVNCPETNTPQFFYGVDEYSDKHIELFEEYYHKHCIIDIDTYDGMDVMLKNIEKDFNLAIATNASAPFARRILGSQSLEDLFSFIIGADNVAKAKPDPEMLFRVMDNFSKKKEDYVFIGDSKKDELAAKNAGIEYLMVDWGFSDHDDALTHSSHLEESIYRVFS